MSAWLRTSPNNDAGYVGVSSRGGDVVAEPSYHRVDGWPRYDISFDSGDATTLEACAGLGANGDTWAQVDELSVRQVGRNLRSPDVASHRPVHNAQMAPCRHRGSGSPPDNPQVVALAFEVGQRWA